MLTWWLILLLLVYFGVCISLIFVILIQSGKGGGLSSLAQSSNQISDALGTTSAEKTLNKITTWIAVTFGLFAIGLSIITSTGAGERKASDVLSAPIAPATTTAPETLPPGGQPAVPGSGETIPLMPEGDTLPPPVNDAGALDGVIPPPLAPMTDDAAPISEAPPMTDAAPADDVPADDSVAPAEEVAPENP